MRLFLALVGMIPLALPGTIPQPEPAAPPPAAALPTKAQIGARFLKSITATPFLHVTAKVQHNGRDYEVRAWMSADRVREEVWRNGKIEFAMYVGGGRIQEYTPKAWFKNGTEAEEVLLEYDAGEKNASNTWPRLVPDHDYACKIVGVAADSWLKKEGPTSPQMMLENLDIAALSEIVVDGKPRERLLAERQIDAETKITWDLFLDKETGEVVRQVNTSQRAGKATASPVDFVIEHLQSDKGIAWRLELANLK